MSFLDTLRDKLRRDDDYYDGDDFYDEEFDDDPYSRNPQPTSSRTKLLGNTPRPEAESVSVYTRSGRPLDARPAADYEPEPQRQAPAPRQTAYDSAPSASTTGDIGPRVVSRVTSGQLPPYVLRPVSYDDVQSVVRRVRTNQPVVLVFKNTNIEVAKRILDFSFGLSYGLNGSVEEVGDRVFAVLPEGIELSQTDIDKLVADGDLSR